MGREKLDVPEFDRVSLRLSRKNLKVCVQTFATKLWYVQTSATHVQNFVTKLWYVQTFATHRLTHDQIFRLGMGLNLDAERPIKFGNETGTSSRVNN